ncbi:unnamed protein product [Paramecium octaurelia]|uniref:Uncharacterized protein n=1 Tax=Paramecium octaurelia TaxID=43137 RepID=A0A8S1YFW5_PAROT|nr:unnamed protein product [Paramecium octaurelia]
MQRFESDVNAEGESQAAYTRFESSPSVGQLSGTHVEKQTIIKSTLIASIGSFLFTYGILASAGNNTAILVIFFLSILMTDRLTVFNPAVSLIDLLMARIGFQEFMFNVIGQVGGSLLGAMVCFFVLEDFTNAPYLNAKIGDNLLGSVEGESIGSVLFMVVLALQEDDYLKFSDDKLEHALVVTLGFGAARVLSSEGQSLFNPAFAFSLELFECIQDGSWGRFGFLWVFTCTPFVAAIVAITFNSQVYKRFYDKKVQYGF